MPGVYNEQLTLDAYQDYVASSRHPENTEGPWRERYAKLIQGEKIEFLTQHGPGQLRLLPDTMQLTSLPGMTELQNHMADELCDLVWFGTNSIDRFGLSLSDLCTMAYHGYSPNAVGRVETFAELGKAALETAARITVPNKWGLEHGASAEEGGVTTLSLHPGYVFMRAAHRLSRVLDQGRGDMSPPTATELEPIQDIDLTFGLFFLSMAYIARERLGTSIETVARFNMAKLTHRDLHGKANDLQFADFIARQNSH